MMFLNRSGKIPVKMDLKCSTSCFLRTCGSDKHFLFKRGNGPAHCYLNKTGMDAIYSIHNIIYDDLRQFPDGFTFNRIGYPLVLVKTGTHNDINTGGF